MDALEDRIGVDGESECEGFEIDKLRLKLDWTRLDFETDRPRAAAAALLVGQLAR